VTDAEGVSTAGGLPQECIDLWCWTEKTPATHRQGDDFCSGGSVLDGGQVGEEEQSEQLQPQDIFFLLRNMTLIFQPRKKAAAARAHTTSRLSMSFSVYDDSFALSAGCISLKFQGY
jgi:hypothetical protein